MCSRLPRVVPSLRGNTFSFSLLSMMLAVGLLQVPFDWESSLLFLVTKCFFNPCYEKVLDSGKCFFFPAGRCVFCFIVLKWHSVDWLSYNEPTLHTSINPMWSWYTIFFICCWILFGSILLRTLSPVFIRDIGCMCVCDVSVWYWYERNTGINLPAMWGRDLWHKEWSIVGFQFSQD